MGKEGTPFKEEGDKSDEISKMLDNILSRNEEFKFDDAEIEMPTPASLINDRQDQFLKYNNKEKEIIWNTNASETKIAMGLMLGFVICIMFAIGLKKKRQESENEYMRSRRNSGIYSNHTKV